MDLNQKLKHWIRPRNIARALLHMLPKSQRFNFYRNMAVVNYELPSNLKFRVARTQEDLEQAFKILHDEYVRAGFMKPDPSGMRVTAYHALPSTSTLIAVENDEVVATASIVRDSIFGFPLDKIFSTDHLRTNGARLAEISALAIRQDRRQNRGEILFPLLKFVYEYCTDYFGVDYKLIAVNPKHIEFYQALLFFELLDQNIVTEYDFVAGAPAVGGYLDLREAYKKFAFNYGKKPKNKNLFHYFTEHQFASFEFPDRSYFKISDPIMTPELLEYFFNEKTNVFQSLPDRERAALFTLYKSECYRKVLPKPSFKYDFDNSRRSPRHDVGCHGRIVFSQKRMIKMRVRDVSLKGFKAILDSPIRFGEKLTINIALADFDIAELTGWPVWQGSNNAYGFILESWSPNWEEFVVELEAELNQSSMAEARLLVSA